MTREEQIKAIYEKIADKTLSFGCKIIMRDREYIFISEWNKKIENIKWNLYLNTEAKYILDFICPDKIIWHPVMIWDVLDYWENLEENKNYWWYYQYEVIKDIIEFWKEKRKPIEEQSDDTIEFIFNLIK